MSRVPGRVTSAVVEALRENVSALHAELVRYGLVVWTAGDLNAVPPALRSVAADAAVQPPLSLHYLRGDSSLNIGWAILHPRPSYAAESLKPPP